MAKITRDEVLKLARLARLELSDKDIDKFQTEISDILSYIEILNKVDTDDLKPTYQVTNIVNSSRDDEIIDYGIERDDLLKNVPRLEGEYIKVNRMIG